MTRRTAELDQTMVDLMQDGLSYTQACKAVGVDRKTVNRWRDKDPALDDRLLSANKLGTVCLNDAILKLVIDDKVAPEEALGKAVDKEDLRLKLQVAGFEI